MYSSQKKTIVTFKRASQRLGPLIRSNVMRECKLHLLYMAKKKNVKGQLILILKSAASRPVASFHQVKEIILYSILKTGLIIFSARANQKISLECTTNAL